MEKPRKKTKKKYNFIIPIGDWSGDGHNEVIEFRASSKKPIEKIREAYFTARKEYPSLSPESFCNDADDKEIPEKVRIAAKKLGCKINFDDFSFQDMAEYVIWFIHLVDPKAKIKLLPEKSLPMLQFYGNDSKNRHISGFGYGLFSF